ncbi:MAG: hypothetical protein VX730_05605 [Pseudomonadota bacterium]|nr:hypothetical protein [Pseudomonadota bacterium]
MADTPNTPTVSVSGRVRRAQKKGPDGEFKGYKGTIEVALSLKDLNNIEGKKPFLRQKSKGGIWRKSKGDLFTAQFRMPKDMPNQALQALNEGREGANVGLGFTGNILTEIVVYYSTDSEECCIIPCGPIPKKKEAAN